MELGDMLRILWKRSWLVVLCTLLGSVGAFVVSTSIVPVYQAKVIMMVNQTTEMPFADLTSLRTGERLAQTYSQLLMTRPLLEIVIKDLGLDLTPEELSKNRIATTLIPETQLLELTVKDTDPKRASDIANGIALTFISTHNIEQQLHGITELEQDLTSEIAHLKELIQLNRAKMDEMRTLNLVPEEETSRLEAALASQQDAYATLLSTYLAVRRLQTQVLDVTVVEPAIAPRKPVHPDVMLYTLIGGFVGLNGSVGLAFLLEHLDHSLKTSDDVRKILSLPVLSSIPELQGEERRSVLTASAFPHSSVSEAYRTLRTNIRFVSVDEPLGVLLVTSAGLGEGKSRVSINLAIVCAQAGLRVVLVDTDLRCPQLHQQFNLENRVGLTDLLVGDLQSAKECTLETEISNLCVITSGPLPPNPSELLASKRLEVVLAEVRQNAELVILDTPPVLAVTDAAILAHRVDGALFVVYAGKTRRDLAQNAVERLLQVGTNVLGVVLNAVRTSKKSYYYYSYHRRPERKPGRWLRRQRDYLASTLRTVAKKQRPNCSR